MAHARLKQDQRQAKQRSRSSLRADLQNRSKSQYRKKAVTCSKDQERAKDDQAKEKADLPAKTSD